MTEKISIEKQLFRWFFTLHFSLHSVFCYAWNYVLNKYLHEHFFFLVVLLHVSCYVIKCRRKRRFNYHCLEYSLQLFLLREFLCFYFFREDKKKILLGVYTSNVYEMKKHTKFSMENASYTEDVSFFSFFLHLFVWN